MSVADSLIDQNQEEFGHNHDPLCAHQVEELDEVIDGNHLQPEGIFWEGEVISLYCQLEDVLEKVFFVA